jgi:hypothetical protein
MHYVAAVDGASPPGDSIAHHHHLTNSPPQTNPQPQTNHAPLTTNDDEAKKRKRNNRKSKKRKKEREAAAAEKRAREKEPSAQWIKVHEVDGLRDLLCRQFGTSLHLVANKPVSLCVCATCQKKIAVCH